MDLVGEFKVIAMESGILFWAWSKGDREIVHRNGVQSMERLRCFPQ